ncbi:diacylglycerol/lipid kinase family protein [Balneola vulgaris]|uniref:diacylglycerol/lipid kinase family protein n=1 Tax=Balneola vulgaris TaxID=287535 RepID=UPI00037C0433|nr:YegS/Rv2252/BmrU family lipid kinase [Balneola vulgaris]
MQNSYTFIVNANSNSGRAATTIKRATLLIRNRFPDASILFTSEPTKLTQWAAEAATHSNIVVACGGDGTMQSVARGLLNTSAIMGVIPIGSGNDFAKAMGLPTHQNIAYYLDMLLQHRMRQVDVPTVNGEAFINTLGIGFDGLTNLYASQFSFLKGALKYTIAGLKAFLTAKTFSLHSWVGEEETFQDVWLVAIANGSVEGGRYIISPQSSNHDGKLELIVVPSFNRLKLGWAFIQLSLGKPLTSPYRQLSEVQQVRIATSTAQPIHLDGENGPYTKDFEISISPTKLKVIGA